MRLRCAIAVTLLLVSSGCASTPTVLRGDFYSPISPTQAALEHRTGAYVRWGGEILSVTHGRDDTCFEVLGQPLDSRAKPRRTDLAEGRFRACAPGFYDPAIYKEGRSITTTGVIQRETTQSFEAYQLQVPVVSADVVYLWPHRVYYATAYGGYPYGWGWPYYGWGPYYGPWWWGWGFGGPYLGYGYGYRYPYRYGSYRGGGGGGKRGHHGGGGRMIRGGSGGNAVRGGGGTRVGVGRR